jgi:hypothetical protein
MSIEYDIATDVAQTGLKALRGVLKTIMDYDEPMRVKYVREIAECVKAAAVVMKEEREQLEFEKEESLSPTEIQAAIENHLSAMSIPELQRLIEKAMSRAGGELTPRPSEVHA